MNEAERTNSAIGDALGDRETIHWDKDKLFNGLTGEDMSNLTLNQFEEHKKIMGRNALDVTEEVVYRLDGAPALGEFIDACKSLVHTPEHDDCWCRQESLCELESLK